MICGRTKRKLSKYEYKRTRTCLWAALHPGTLSPAGVKKKWKELDFSPKAATKHRLPSALKTACSASEAAAHTPVTPHRSKRVSRFTADNSDSTEIPRSMFHGSNDRQQDMHTPAGWRKPPLEPHFCPPENEKNFLKTLAWAIHPPVIVFSGERDVSRNT